MELMELVRMSEIGIVPSTHAHDAGRRSAVDAEESVSLCTEGDTTVVEALEVDNRALAV